MVKVKVMAEYGPEAPTGVGREMKMEEASRASWREQQGQRKKRKKHGIIWKRENELEPTRMGLANVKHLDRSENTCCTCLIAGVFGGEAHTRQVRR